MRKFMLIWGSLIAVYADAFYLVHAVSPRLFLVTTGSLVASFALFAVLSRGVSLILLVVEVLGLGFGLVLDGWVTGANTMVQAKDIALHVTLSATVILLWLTARYVRDLFYQNLTLQAELSKLKKQDEQTGILTFDEFKYRLEAIWAGLRRRHETGYLLKISLPPLKHTQKAVFGKVSQSALESIRAHYDIVGMMPDGEIAIILQNTEEPGVDLVEKRFVDLVSEQVAAQTVNTLAIHRIKMDLTFNESAWWLHHVMGPSSLAERGSHGL